MSIRIRELGKDRILFEAAVKRAGSQAAKQAFARAINHEMAKANTAVKRALRDETGAKAGDVAKAIKRKNARAARLTAEIVA